MHRECGLFHRPALNLPAVRVVRGLSGPFGKGQEIPPIPWAHNALQNALQIRVSSICLWIKQTYQSVGGHVSATLHWYSVLLDSHQQSTMNDFLALDVSLSERSNCRGRGSRFIYASISIIYCVVYITYQLQIKYNGRLLLAVTFPHILAHITDQEAHWLHFTRLWVFNVYMWVISRYMASTSPGIAWGKLGGDRLTMPEIAAVGSHSLKFRKAFIFFLLPAICRGLFMGFHQMIKVVISLWHVFCCRKQSQRSSAPFTNMD